MTGTLKDVYERFYEYATTRNLDKKPLVKSEFRNQLEDVQIICKEAGGNKIRFKYTEEELLKNAKRRGWIHELDEWCDDYKFTTDDENDDDDTPSPLDHGIEESKLKQENKALQTTITKLQQQLEAQTKLLEKLTQQLSVVDEMSEESSYSEEDDYESEAIVYETKSNEEEEEGVYYSDDESESDNYIKGQEEMLELLMN